MNRFQTALCQFIILIGGMHAYGMQANARSSITIGRQKVLVVLAEYPDRKFVTKDAHTAFDRMMNEPGYSDYGAAGSARDYFIDNSFGQYEPDIQVYGPVMLPHEMSYYGAPNGNKHDSRPAELVRDACQQIDGEVDFSEYDLDGDGIIDNVYVFYAGYAQSHGADPNTMWPQGGYANQGYGMQAYFDEVMLDRFAFSNEVELFTNRLMGIGVFCHEFCHSLGLPDFYPTDNSHDRHPASWSLMATGGSNNDGRTPPNLSAYERYALGWLTPKELTCTDTLVTLPDISHNEAYIIKTKDPNEYFLLENRQQKKWDAYLPGHGLLVWHIDFEQLQWSRNTPNNNPEHQHVDIEEADGDASLATKGGDAFPGQGEWRTMTDDTQPALLAWNGSRRDIGLYNIDETDDSLIVFNVVNTTGQLPKTIVREAKEVTPVSFVACWDKVEGATSYVLEAYRKDGTRKQYIDGYRLKHLGDVDSELLEGLDPECNYYYRVRAMGNGFIGEYSDEQPVRTLDKDFRFFAPVVAEAAEVASTSFTACWEAMDEATGYFVTVSAVSHGEAYEVANDFSQGEAQPEGWSTNALGMYEFSGYYGQAAPSLKVDKDGVFLRSPIEEGELESLSFWYKGFSSQDGNRIVVSGYREGAWQELGVIDPVETNKEGTTVTLDVSRLGEPCRAVNIVYERGSRGSMALDDVVLVYRPAESEPLPGYADRSAGNVLSLQVTGLLPNTLYRYKVKATNGSLESLYSFERSVRTRDEENGLDDVAGEPRVALYAANGRLTVDNRSGSPCQVEVCSVSGLHVASCRVAAGETTQVMLPAGGMYVVRIGGKAYKVAM